MRKVMKKWNFETHQYEEYIVPLDWNVSMYETDMDKVVNCAECGKQIKYGESYTSVKIHDEVGFGYAVCYECHCKGLKQLIEEHEKLEFKYKRLLSFLGVDVDVYHYKDALTYIRNSVLVTDHNQKERVNQCTEVLQDLVDKATPKKPDIYTDTRDDIVNNSTLEVDCYLCPKCGEYICDVGDEDKDYAYCCLCGQRLDWSDER